MLKTRKDLSAAFLLVFLGAYCLRAATNDLVITSITKQSECVTLQWRSHPGEFYTVYWTDKLELPVFWRVAEVNVPSGGTNTAWSEGNCSESMIGSGGSSALSAEQKAAFIEKHKEFTAPDYLFPPGHPNAPKSTNTTATGGSGSGGQMALLSSPATANRFYRVARTGVVGFVDGWGGTLGSIPTNLGPVATYKTITVSASPRGDSGAHSLALLTNGTVVAWGVTNYGQCNVPTNLADVVSIAAGGRHSMALTRDGEIVMWGNTALGQITNRPAAATNIAAIAAGLWHSMALRADGTVFAWGDLFNGTNAVPADLSNVTAIAAGPRHCLALRHNGTVAAWGFDFSFLKNFLPTNVPTDLSNVVAISAGMEHNQALLKDGTLRVWGRPDSVVVTNAPAGLTNLLAAGAGWHYGLALSNNATIARWGQNSGAEGIDSVVALSAGATHALVIRTNSSGAVIRKQPGDVEVPIGTTTNLLVEATSSLALRYQWQRNGTNLIGKTNATLTFASLQDADDGFYQVFVSTDVGTNFSRVAKVSAVHPPVITNQTPELAMFRPQNQGAFDRLRVYVHSKGTDRLAYQWYQNGQWLLRSMSPSNTVFHGTTNDEGAYYVIVRNIAGSATSAVWNVKLRLQGEAIGWGNNSGGQLNSSRAETNLVVVTAGLLHNLGVRENGTVYAWGDNTYGQTNVPAGLTNIIAVAAGTSHSLALREDGHVIAWGWNAYGQTNVPDSATNIIAIAGGDRHSLALRNTGRVLAWGDNSYGATNVPTDLTNASAIAAGYGYSLALLSNGTVRAWGTWVTTPSGLSNVTAIAAGYTHALALKTNGTVSAFGTDFGSGELTVPSGLSNVLQIAAGDRWNLVLRNDGTLVSWGDNTFNQTNLPTNLGDVKQVAAGIGHGLALAYSPVLNYSVNVSQDLLLIYNTNSADSVFVKDYYLAHRPMVGGANVLGIGCITNETALFDEFTNQVAQPILNFLIQHPTKRPTYLILFLDVPSRVHSTRAYSEFGDHPSVSVSIQSNYPGRKPFITHINMNGTNDCKAYIDKLELIGTNYATGRVVISASSGGYGNTNYTIDNIRFGDPNEDPESYDTLGTSATNGLLAAGVSVSAIAYLNGIELYATGQFLTHLTRATNLAGYFSWGVHSSLGPDYAVNGTNVWQGNSRWWLIETVESFNGWRDDSISGQASFLQWFSSGAFGGANYSNTPVGAVSHTDEPSDAGVNDTRLFFGLWASGRSFAVSSWRSRRTVYFQAVGDPLVRR
jgi:alpha-tubulin suppressor-like RCC1 family protein